MCGVCFVVGGHPFAIPPRGPGVGALPRARRLQTTRRVGPRVPKRSLEPPSSQLHPDHAAHQLYRSVTFLFFFSTRNFFIVCYIHCSPYIAAKPSNKENFGIFSIYKRVNILSLTHPNYFIKNSFISFH